MTLGGTFGVELANLSPSMLGSNHIWATLVSPSLTTHGQQKQTTHLLVSVDCLHAHHWMFLLSLSRLFIYFIFEGCLL